MPGATVKKAAKKTANKATNKAASKASKNPVTGRPAAKTAKPGAQEKGAQKTASLRKAGAPAATAPKKSEKNSAPKQKMKPVTTDKPQEKTKKEKMVRDSFTMPESEYKVLGEVKRACLKDGVAIKKSELLRVGVELIRRMSVADLKQVLTALPPMKAGRPKKNK